jgi:hypothetical protein
MINQSPDPEKAGRIDITMNLPDSTSEKAIAAIIAYTPKVAETTTTVPAPSDLNATMQAPAPSTNITDAKATNDLNTSTSVTPPSDVNVTASTGDAMKAKLASILAGGPKAVTPASIADTANAPSGPAVATR